MKYVLGLALFAVQIAVAEVPSACLSSGNAPLPIKFQAAYDLDQMPLPRPDVLDVVRACARGSNYTTPVMTPLPLPKSAWLETQRDLATTLLAKSKPDVLVVPMQIQGYGIDRVERMLMTADLAYELSASGVRVADPFLVSKAFGEGRRRFDDNEWQRIAAKIGARTIVLSYVGHDQHHNLSLTTITITGTVRQQKDWPRVAFTDADPPLMVFHRLLNEVVSATGTKKHASVAESRKAVVIPSALPASLKELITLKANQISPSVALAMLTAVSDSLSEHSQEYLAERLWLTSIRYDAEGNRANMLRAYALYKLNFRPAALELLKGMSDDSSTVLRELLNGNLPPARAALTKVNAPVEKLILGLGVAELAIIYDPANKQRDIERRLTELGLTNSNPTWQFAAANRLGEYDHWYVPDPLQLKVQLDREFPIPGLNAEAVAPSGNISPNAQDSGVAVEFATLRHIRSLYAQGSVVPCCTRDSTAVNTLDLAAYFTGWTESSVAKELRLRTSMQALPQRAWQRAEALEPMLGGTALLAVQRAKAAASISMQLQDDMEKVWVGRAEENATFATQYAGGQNRIATDAIIGMQSFAARPYMHAYGYDYPRRAFWPTSYYGATPPTAVFEEALAYSMHDMQSAMELRNPAASAAERELVVGKLNQRFLGNPKRNNFVQVSVPSSTPAAPLDLEARWRAEIDKDPSDWSAYTSLAQILIARDDYDEAYKVAMSCPELKNQNPAERVGASNGSYLVGSLFFWHGRPDLAKPFYEYSAALNTGSSASLTSSLRLQMMNGNFVQAAVESLGRGQRYSDPYAYRDYLGFLYAFGESKLAWDGFSSISSSFENPQVWIAALIGHRKDGRSDEFIRAWLQQPENRLAHFRGRNFALPFAIMAADTDRIPPKNFRQYLEAIEGEPEAFIASGGMNVVIPHPLNASGIQELRPSAFRRGKNPPMKEKTRIRSRYVLFGDAYAALRNGEFATAVERFTAYADRYPLEDEGAYVLPYFARAAAKTGDTMGLRAHMEKMEYKDRSFDYWLARAYFSAVAKDVSDAELSLKRAFAYRPYTDYRPIQTEYEFAEACEWIFNETKDPRFEAMLLKWSRQHQKIQPPYAWAYTMEYSHSKPGPERTRALAISLYLDPLSPRLKNATTAERAAAKDWMAKNNPFDPKRTPNPLQASR